MPGSYLVNWDEIDLSRSTADIRALLKKRGITVSKSAVTAARRVREIPSPQGHGGKRIGAGNISIAERKRRKKAK